MNVFFTLLLTALTARGQPLSRSSFENYVGIMDQFITYFNLSVAFLNIERGTLLENNELLEHILKKGTITSHIHVEDPDDFAERHSYPPEEFLMFINYNISTLQATTNWFQLDLVSACKVTFIILTERNQNFEEIRYTLSSNHFLHAILFSEGKVYEFEKHQQEEKVLLKSPREYEKSVESRWPRIIIGPIEEKFPLLVKLGTKFSGMVYYFISAFQKYVDNRIMSKLQDKNLLESRDGEYLSPSPTIYYGSGYPLMKTYECFMLPILDETQTEDYLTNPFTFSVWILLGASNLLLALILRCTIIDDFYKGVMEVFTGLMGSTVNALHKPHFVYKAVYIQVFIFGFIILNLYNSKLSTDLTIDPGRTLKTVDDLIKFNVSVWAAIPDVIIMYKPEVEYIENYTAGLFNPHIDKELYNKILNEWDPKRGYLMPDYTWAFWEESQKLLNRKIFSYSDICPVPSLLFPFSYLHYETRRYFDEEMFSYFTMKVQENGLFEIWNLLTFNDLHFPYKRNDARVPASLTLDFFTIAWKNLVVGWSLSLVIFFIENLILCLKFKN